MQIRIISILVFCLLLSSATNSILAYEKNIEGDITEDFKLNQLNLESYDMVIICT